MLCWEIWQIFSANAFIIGKTQIRKSGIATDAQSRFLLFICMISKVYFAANTNSPVMSLKNTLYVPAGTLILLSTPFFVQVP